MSTNYPDTPAVPTPEPHNVVPSKQVSPLIIEDYKDPEPTKPLTKNMLTKKSRKQFARSLRGIPKDNNHGGLRERNLYDRIEYTTVKS